MESPSKTTPLFSTLAILVAISIYAIISTVLYVLIFIQPTKPNSALPFKTEWATPEAMNPLAGQWVMEVGGLHQLERANDLTVIFPQYYTNDKRTPYYVQTQFRLLDGEAGAGLLFNMGSDTATLNGHMLRLLPAPDGFSVLYGFYDAEGAYNGQGQTATRPLDQVMNQSATLTAVVGITTYDIYLNQEKVAERIPLLYRGGASGLLSANADILFERLQGDFGQPTREQLTPQVKPQPTPVPSVSVDAAPTEPSATLLLAPDFSQLQVQGALRVLSGEWQFEGLRATQSTTAGFDHTVFLPYQLENVQIEVSITHLERVGAGLIFASPSYESLANAYMVRFLDAQTLIWGYFDPNGFVAQGTATLPTVDGTQTLAVKSDATSYAIRVNDALIAEAIPLNQNMGYVGLTMSESSAYFENLNIHFSHLNSFLGQATNE